MRVATLRDAEVLISRLQRDVEYLRKQVQILMSKLPDPPKVEEK